MDANELIKAAPEVGKIAAAIGFTDGVRRMLGPAADEVGEMLRDRVKLYRYERQIRLLEKFDRMAQEVGFTPEAVPPKILFPLLEGASFEDDEDLHTMWAALLANAASPENAFHARPGFIAILKHMSPDEATILVEIDKVTTQILEEPVQANSPSHLAQKLAFRNATLMSEIRTALRKVYGEDPPSEDQRFETCVRLLQNYGLVEVGADILTISPLGRTFLEAVRPPQPAK